MNYDCSFPYLFSECVVALAVSLEEKRMWPKFGASIECISHPPFSPDKMFAEGRFLVTSRAHVRHRTCLKNNVAKK